MYNKKCEYLKLALRVLSCINTGNTETASDSKNPASWTLLSFGGELAAYFFAFVSWVSTHWQDYIRLTFSPFFLWYFLKTFAASRPLISPTLPSFTFLHPHFNSHGDRTLWNNSNSNKITGVYIYGGIMRICDVISETPPDYHPDDLTMTRISVPGT